MSGLLKARSGQFFIEGKYTKQKELYKSVYFVMQDADYQLYSDSVVSELMLSSMNSIKQNDEKIDQYIKEREEMYNGNDKIINKIIEEYGN